MTEALQTLLSTQEPVWDDVEGLESRSYCDVGRLFREHPHDVIGYLQADGIAKLGEFEAPDRTVFPVFQREGLLTLGSSARDIQYEREWTRVLDTKAKRLGRKKADRDKQEEWETDVAVEAFVVTVRGAAGADKDGLLQPLLKRWQQGRCSHLVFALPAVQTVINFKWSTWARRLMLWELGLFLLWLVSFNVFTIAFQDEDLSMSLAELVRTTQGAVTVAAELLALLGMLPFLLLEAGTVVAYGWGWLDSRNFLDFCTYAVQIVISTMHLGRWELAADYLSVLPALQLVLLVIRLQFYLQVFRPTRFALLDTMRTVVNDMKWIFGFMLIVMWYFGSAFHIVFRRDQDKTDFDTILHSFVTMYEHQGGYLDLKQMYSSKSPIAATFLALAYKLAMGFVLSNLLVGVVVHSIDKATEDAEAKQLLSQARIIDELEATMPRWLERRNPHWYPQYVHALRIDTDKLDEVKRVGLWSWVSMKRGSKKEREEEGAAATTATGATTSAATPPAASATAAAGAVPAGNGAMTAGGASGGGTGGSGGSGGVAGAVPPGVDVQAALAELRTQLEEQGLLLRAIHEQQQLRLRTGPKKG